MTETKEQAPQTGRAGRVAGYIIAIVVNAVFLYLVNHLLDWEWPPFLTDRFGDVLPLVNLSLAATIAANVVWLLADPRWLKSSIQIALNVVSLVVTVRLWQVFPFDFSGYAFDWEVVARVLLVLGLAGLAIGTIAEVGKLVAGTRKA